ncbi:hypothetical protein [Roseomonas sp. USHLN139]|uniref:hypothetical protein n=1 Tax=Roseomonas sp. USHLN139 TaxID=3081298 RepID=UPI003B02045A
MASARTFSFIATCRRVFAAALLACLLAVAATQGHGLAQTQTQTGGTPQDVLVSMQQGPHGEVPQPDQALCECLHTVCSKLVARAPELAATSATPALRARLFAGRSRVLLSGVVDQLSRPPRA